MLPDKPVALGTRRSVIRELFEYGNRRAAEIGRENVFDFSLGNPNVPPPPAVSASIRRLLDAESPIALHGYTSAPGDPNVRKAIAEYITRTYGVQAGPADIYMTVGAAACLRVCFEALLDPGEEVLSFAPHFPEYKVFVESAGGVFRAVPSRESDFQPDMAALEAALNPKTVALILNSPNNPSGTILTEESLCQLADALKRAEVRFGHPIYLIADEPYRELVYDGTTVPYVPCYYDNTLVCYSFSKSLSMPGGRIGYVFVPKAAEPHDCLMAAIAGAGRALGYVCAPSLFQRVVADCLGLTADLDTYRVNRDLLYTALTQYGFSAVYPAGAFYLFVKSPEPDAKAFSERAKQYELLLVPSDDFGIPGYVRISYCVDTDTIRRSLPAFRQLAEAYHLTEEHQ